MSVSFRFLVSVALIGAANFLEGTAIAQSFRSHSATLKVTTTPSELGGTVYGLTTIQTGLLSAGIPIDGGTLVAPDGTQFGSPSDSVERATFAEIEDLLFGDWTAIESPTDGPEVSYQFRVSPFSLNDVFTQVPIITAPEPGSFVPPEFVVQWEFDRGGTPTSRGFHVHTGSEVDVVDREIGTDGFYSARFLTKRQSPGAWPVEVQVNSSSFVPQPQLISKSPSLQGDSFFFLAYFETRSALTTFYVIPEPSTLSLVAIAGLVFAGYSQCLVRRPRRNRRR